MDSPRETVVEREQKWLPQTQASALAAERDETIADVATDDVQEVTPDD